jgi:rfaE bifunctional protein nucleotidyltransferase chain/domain
MTNNQISKRVLTLKETLTFIKKLKGGGKTIVLVGGCFDILHLGHLKFLEAAKQQGNILIVALENDENIKRLKGKDRPVNKEKFRAQKLIETGLVDWVIILPVLQTADSYLKMVQDIKPDVIAITRNDPQKQNKKNQARLVGAKVVSVISHLKGFSTSRLLAQKK